MSARWLTWKGEAKVTTSNQRPEGDSAAIWQLMRDKIIPVLITAALLGTFGSGLAMWKELAVMNVKLDQKDRIDQGQDAVLHDHEGRIRGLERGKPDSK